MEIIKLEKLAKILNPRGVTTRKVFESESVNILNVFLKSGEKIDSHITPVDVFFYVVNGKGKIEIGEKSGIVAKTDIVISPKNIPHAVYASEGENFEILVVKTPNPAKLR